MGEQDPHNVNFFRDNLILILLVALGIFGYLIMIIRKRWKQNFLHREKEKA